MTGKSYKRWMALLFLAVTIAALTDSQRFVATTMAGNLEERGLHIAIIPEKNIFEQKRRYKYITTYLSEKLGIDVHIDIMSNYGQICDAFLEGTADAGFLGSFSYLLTHAKAGIEPIVRPVWLDGSSTYRGYIFVRRDSGIDSIAGMKDRSIVLVDKATTAGYIFPLYYFKYSGISDMGTYFDKIYFAGSHDASAWAVYTGEAEIGGGKNHIFNELAAEYPDFAEQMVVLAESPAMPSNGLAVRKDLNPALKMRLRDLLVGLDNSTEGREVLKNFGAKKFINTRDEDYRSLYDMVEKLEIDLANYPYLQAPSSAKQ